MITKPKKMQRGKDKKNTEIHINNIYLKYFFSNR